MNTAQTTVNALPWWYHAVTWAVIAIGWLVVSYQNDKRETRKELRAKIDSIIKHVDETTAQAVEYHTKPRDQRIEIVLKSSLGRLAANIVILHAPLNGNFAYHTFRFRQSITLLNFETSDHAPYPASSSYINDIYGAAEELITNIEASYSKSFHKTRLLDYLPIDFGNNRQ